MSTGTDTPCRPGQSPRTNAAVALLIEVAALSLDEDKKSAEPRPKGPKISSASLMAINCAWEETSYVGTVGRWIRRTCAPDAPPPRIVCTICGDEMEPGWSAGELHSRRTEHPGSVLPCMHVVGTECWVKLITEQGTLDCPVCGEDIDLDEGPGAVAHLFIFAIISSAIASVHAASGFARTCTIGKTTVNSLIMTSFCAKTGGPLARSRTTLNIDCGKGG
ncbi:uncharacterized protein PpBr36_10059 [Pyricularia pennisetigena]|uniref:uncharacterized protein n=1 Tax=Pyricularia pennisetigena TaxID=1578925 RepID=UPI00114FDCD1|nr:uncharacterized protein PpBr36_10059 [Pyricularia pennisetigena]TLS22224.1 hypothetical protein PpBr36_10059 [Pyricularia pennisetigena]